MSPEISQSNASWRGQQNEDRGAGVRPGVQVGRGTVTLGADRTRQACRAVMEGRLDIEGKQVSSRSRALYLSSYNKETIIFKQNGAFSEKL